MCKPRGVPDRYPLADLPGRPCSIAASLELVGERWALLVVREVSLGNHRFSDIARGTGAPRDRLSARLSALVAAGVLERRPYSTAPPRSGYHLTESGRDLLPVLQALLQWGDRWVADAPPIELHHAPRHARRPRRRRRLDLPHLRRTGERLARPAGAHPVGPSTRRPAPRRGRR